MPNLGHFGLQGGGQTVNVSATGVNVSAGTQIATTGTAIFSNSNNISFGMSNNSVITAIASFNQTVQAGVTAIGVSTGGNAAGNTGTTQGTYVLVGGNNVTLSQMTGTGGATVTISAQQNAIQAAGVSTGGNTSGTTGTNFGTLVLAGGNNITLSQSVTAGGPSITISGPNMVSAFGVSSLGNTAGNTGTTLGTIVLSGGANITLSQSTNASGATIGITGPASVASATVVSALGVSNIGNTAGNTGTTVGTIVFSGQSNITISQATGTGGATIGISAPNVVSGTALAPTINYFDNLANNQNGGQWASTQKIQVGPLQAVRNGVFPGNMTVQTILFPVTGSSSAQTDVGNISISLSLGLYTVSASTKLNIVNSASYSTTFAASNSTLFQGFRYITLGTGAWSSSPVLSNTLYYYGVAYRGSSQTIGGAGSGNMTLLGQVISPAAQWSGTVGVSQAAATTQGMNPFFGQYSTTSASLPTTIAYNELRKTSADDLFVPCVVLNNLVSSY